MRYQYVINMINKNRKLIRLIILIITNNIESVSLLRMNVRELNFTVIVGHIKMDYFTNQKISNATPHHRLKMCIAVGIA